MQWTKEKLENLILKTDPLAKRGSLDVNCALVCLAPAVMDDLGQDYKNIARRLMLDREIVRQWVGRLRANGLWDKGEFCYGDLQESDIALWLYVLVAQGKVVVIRDGKLLAETQNGQNHRSLPERDEHAGDSEDVPCVQRGSGAVQETGQTASAVQVRPDLRASGVVYEPIPTVATPAIYPAPAEVSADPESTHGTMGEDAGRNEADSPPSERWEIFQRTNHKNKARSAGVRLGMDTVRTGTGKDTGTIPGGNEMAQGVAQAHEAGEGTSTRAQLALAAQNIKTAADFARFMTAVMSALLTGQIDPPTATAICGTANTMLKAIEMQVRYLHLNQGKKELLLTEAAAVTDVPEVTHVTSKPSLPAKEPISHKSDTTGPEIKPKKGAPWCNDCYVGRKLYITAVEEVEGDPLCLPCANKRRKLMNTDFDAEKISTCLHCEKEGKKFKTGSPQEWILHNKMSHGITLDLASVEKAWADRLKA